jgi:hypothetical protein
MHKIGTSMSWYAITIVQGFLLLYLQIPVTQA